MDVGELSQKLKEFDPLLMIKFLDDETISIEVHDDLTFISAETNEMLGFPTNSTHWYGGIHHKYSTRQGRSY